MLRGVEEHGGGGMHERRILARDDGAVGQLDGGAAMDAAFVFVPFGGLLRGFAGGDDDIALFRIDLRFADDFDDAVERALFGTAEHVVGLDAEVTPFDFEFGGFADGFVIDTVTLRSKGPTTGQHPTEPVPR